MGNEYAVILCAPVDGSDDNSDFGQHLYSDRTQSRAFLVLCTLVMPLIFTARRNARIASAVLAMAFPSVCPSVCPSVRLTVTRRYCVKTTARSTVQFAPSDSKMSSFVETKNIPEGRPLSPEILAPSDLPCPDSSES